MIRSAPVIKVDNDKCVNCYACVTACPVKYCIDGSGDTLRIDPNLCIGCGHCVAACRHQARAILDDAEAFFTALDQREKVLAIMAPSAAANFPGSYLNLNGYLKSLGVSAVFDVSFGAELAALSYADYIKEANPAFLIAQPCPAIVTYLEIYHPELLPSLAPVDSPMVHLIKMIREFFPEYREHKIAAISPCVAKRREFDETGCGDFNVTYLSLKQRLERDGLDLDAFPEVEFSGPEAERAVVFSRPGGLVTTLDREIPGIWERSRQISGVDQVYPYLRELAGSLGRGKREPQAAFLVDCLSCDKGCNGGPASDRAGRPVNELEAPLWRRRLEQEAKYQPRILLKKQKNSRTLQDTLARYWKKGLYTRTYHDRSPNNTVKEPDPIELSLVYASIGKHTERDIYDCTSCGYGSCRAMATAIFNHLNQPRNCHHYDLLLVRRGDELKKLSEQLQAQRDEITVMKDNLRAGIFLLDPSGAIQPQYSRELERILDRGSLQGQNFLTLLSSSLSGRDLKGIRDYFDLIFTGNLDKDMLDDVNPIAEFEYFPASLPFNGAQTGKMLRSTFTLVAHPGAPGGERAFIMGTLEDVTVEKRLQRELAEAESKRQEEMHSLFEVIQVDPQVLNDFIEDTDVEFEKINAALKNPKLNSRNAVMGIYQSVHAIKSNALILGFDSFAGMLQELETRIKEMSTQEEVPFDAVLRLTVELERMMRERDKVSNALDRISSFAAKGVPAGGLAGDRERNQVAYVLEESLKRACERAAEATDKQARFVLEDFDPQALEWGARRVIKEILIQLIRNAVYHGIERPQVRRSRGKQEAGTVVCSIQVTGEAGTSGRPGSPGSPSRRVFLRLSDDGRGLDFALIEARAREKGLLPATAGPGEVDKNRILSLIFMPLFSTAGEASLQAGRGVGLSLVHDRVRELGGSIKVRTTPGRGTTFEITFPFTPREPDQTPARAGAAAEGV